MSSSADIEQTIIGTAGHIDHGKTALIKALTGIDTDTLAEEKKRGITIELGFAFLETPGFDKQIMFIDVPGHEKLIKTMVAGASNIDAALLVVAADEGISVQTIEHFDILQLLEIETGVIALTKIDQVDEARVRAVSADVKALVAGTFLDDAPVIPVSSITGAGVDEVRSALTAAARRVRERRDTGVFRMPVDRIFTMQGFGTVIAGTILSGQVNVGDRLEILPEGITTKVRGIQVHSQSVPRSYIGRRTAVNLQDVKKELLRRGQCACAPGSMTPTNRLDARLYVSKSYGEELRNRTRLRLHIGADEAMCRALLLDAEKLAPGQTALVQFVLESLTTALPRDRFVIRMFSSEATVGGGMVLDALPKPHKRFDEVVLDALRKLEGGVVDAVEQAFAKSNSVPRTPAEVALTIAERECEVEEAVERLCRAGKLVRISTGTSSDGAAFKRGKYLHTECYNDLADKLLNIIDDYYAKDPYRLLMPLSDLQSRFLKFGERPVFEAVVSDLCSRGVLCRRDNKVGVADRQAALTESEREAAERIEGIFKNAGCMVPSEEEVLAEVRISPKSFENVMTTLIDQGRLVRLNDKVTYHKDHLERVRKLVVDYIGERRSITVAELRDKLGVSRKYALAVLEHFDSIFLTRRDGDRRVLR